MAGFMSSTSALKIFVAPAGGSADGGKLEKHVFSPTPGPDGKRIGWVGLGDPLDTNFSFGVDHGRFLAFSLRVDERKPSAAAIKIRLAEALRKEAGPDGTISKQRRRELKEQVTDAVTARAEYLPTLTDCVWDTQADRLYVSTTSSATLTTLLDLFQATFGINPEPLTPEADMSEFFARVFKESLPVNGLDVSAGSSVTLATPQHQEDKAGVSVTNSESAVSTALNEGLHITKMALIAAGEEEYAFVLADDLSVTGLKLPNGEKGDEADVTFILKADCLARIAALVEALGK